MKKVKSVRSQPKRNKDAANLLKSVLAMSGLKKGIDYEIQNNQSLRINKHQLKGKILMALKESCPQYSYYWETPKVLTWF